MRKTLTTLISLALLLTACGGDGTPGPVGEPAPTTIESEAPTTAAPKPTEPPEPETLEPGTYTFETSNGTTGTMEIPGQPLPEVEALREQAGAEPVTYITATIDNREGEEAFDFYQVSIYDPAGEEYLYTPAGEYVFDIIPEDAPTDQYNQYIDLSNSFTEIIDPLQQAESVLIGPAIPEEMTGVVVSNGFESFEAVPAE